MANTSSAQKAARQAIKRTAINRARVSKIRTLVKNVETAIASGNRADAAAAYRLAEPAMKRGIVNGVLHRNTVARKLSRLTKRINALS